MTIYQSIKRLTSYALERHLISENERDYSINLLLDVLNLDEYIEPEEEYEDVDLEEVLKDILDYATEHGLLEGDSVVYRDLFDTKVMNCFTPRPDTVICEFYDQYWNSPEACTDWFYRFSKDTDYVRSYRIKKDMRWKTDTEYGPLDITINLSKPEKDPKAIAAAKNVKSSSYPRCQLCAENEGYRGRIDHPARETIRLIPLKLDGDDFFFQYSPYSYYNEHCIVLNKRHVPMVIDEKAFRHLFAFVKLFPHYMLGSNADLPIVGGSILTHDHYQGGRYEFPMFRADEVCSLSFVGYDDVKASFLHWPVSDIRLRSPDPEKLISLSVKILEKWRDYSDPELFIYSETDGVRHNTITPIVHKVGDDFIIDLALRNNITTSEYPLGVYHPHPEYWNIKKENIGLIEVMGLAVLPSRLKSELSSVRDKILHHEDLTSDPATAKHASWVESFIGDYQIDENNIDDILRRETGIVFKRVLENAGVFKQDEAGRAGLLRFVDSVNHA